VHLADLWRFLHLFFAFGYAGTLTVAEWNSRSARRTREWPQRAVLWDTIRISSLGPGLFGLLMLGVFGNLTAAGLKPRSWVMTVNGLWLLNLLVLAGVCLPGAARLARIARDTAGGGSTEGYDRTYARWRVANALLTLLFVALLVLMVLRWPY
jgi:hypothetical protein